MLFEPRTKSENDLIHQAAEEMDILSRRFDSIHVGINDLKEEGEFVYESSGLPISFENWSFWQGSGGREENCVIIRKGNPKWIDGLCDYRGPSVCHVPIL